VHKKEPAQCQWELFRVVDESWPIKISASNSYHIQAPSSSQLQQIKRAEQTTIPSGFFGYTIVFFITCIFTFKKHTSLCFPWWKFVCIPHKRPGYSFECSQLKDLYIRIFQVLTMRHTLPWFGRVCVLSTLFFNQCVWVCFFAVRAWGQLKYIHKYGRRMSLWSGIIAARLMKRRILHSKIKSHKVFIQKTSPHMMKCWQLLAKDDRRPTQHH